MAARFLIQQIRFNNVLYPGISGWSYDPGNNINSDQLDSTVHETAHHGMDTAPAADLTTRDLSFLSVLDDSTDIWLKALNASYGLELIGGKTSGPGYAGGSVHLMRKGLRGYLFGNGISWSKGGKAELALRALFYSVDGTTPAVSTTATALPPPPAPDFGWKPSAITISGDTISAIESLNIGVEHRGMHDYFAGLPEPSDVLMAPVGGPASWRLNASINQCDLGAGSGAVSVVYRRLASGGGFSGAANSTLTVTFNTNWSIEEGVGGQSGASMPRSLTVRPRFNGTTKPVTWAFS